MIPLLLNQAFAVTALTPVWTSAAFPLDPKTAILRVRIYRPTAINPIAWNAVSTVHVRIVLNLDGVEYVCMGRATGGIRQVGGVDLDAYEIEYRPPWGFFGARGGATKRLGELKQNIYTARVELQHIAGSITSSLDFEVESANAPAVAFRNSVAFDAATDGVETSGDGVFSISHTASGSDRGAAAGNANQQGRTSTSITYAGNAMTEKADQQSAATYGGALYTLTGDASIPTGAQTVESTLSGNTDKHFLGVVTVTGTNGVGTVATYNDFGGAPSVTVGSVGADDLVVDVLSIGTTTIAADAGQTVRNTEDGFGQGFRMSTQPGSSGGVMSWTTNNAQGNLAGINFVSGGSGGGSTTAPGVGVMGVL